MAGDGRGARAAGRRPRRSSRRWAWVVAATAGLAGSGSGSAAQEVAAEPSFALRAPGETSAWALDVQIPPGWALYAAEGGAIGLPLSARWLGGAGVADREAGIGGPPPVEEVHPWGTARVYRGRVGLELTPAPDRAAGLEVRWALCRTDLCVPGVTRIDIPGGPGGTSQKIR